MILNDAENIMIGNTEVLKVYAGDNEVWTRSGFRELRGVPPLSFRGNGTILLDWSITGAAGGVGYLGQNKLKQREYTASDGLSNASLDPAYLGNIVVELFPQNSNDNAPSIPPGTPHTGAYQQWVGMEPGGYVNDYWVIDERSTFANAQWKTVLPAGSYKLMCELCVVDGEAGSFTDLYDRAEEWRKYATVDLITSDNTVLIHRNVSTRYSSASENELFSGYMANYGPAFFHEEIPFTLEEETEVGLIPKLYWYYSDRHDLYFRFYVTDASVIAQPFDDGTYSGVTAWEPYRHKIPVVISSGGQSTAIDIYTVDALTENDTLTMAAAGVALPTYTGVTTININTDITPSEMYIKYSI
jgi:hypothetical protein